jgi:hypothetical protein
MAYEVAIHCNTSLVHQVTLARALSSGFRHHGISAVVTDQRQTMAELHVVMGPWFAFEQWRFGNTLYIDRAYWGDPDNVSVHWLVNGEKSYTRSDDKRATPELKPYRYSEKSIYLCDYDRVPTGLYDAVRYHPANGQGGDLIRALDGYGVAIGSRTTALVDAAIQGLKVVTDSEHSPVWPISGRRGGREQWINRLAWHNWAIQDIERGAAWEHLLQR